MRCRRRGVGAIVGWLLLAAVATVVVHQLLRAKTTPTSSAAFYHSDDDEDEQRSTERRHRAMIYAITPTYARAVQKAELTRLSHTFLLVPRFTWIIVEDAADKTPLVSNFVTRLRATVKHFKSDLQVVHLAAMTPERYRPRPHDPNWLQPRGVMQRNAGLEYLRSLSPSAVEPDAVMFFADDDNTYDLQLFEEMRPTRKVSVWPVGLVGGLHVEKPHVEDGKVVAWRTAWKPERPYPIDMAGFAVSVALIRRRPEARFTYKTQRGMQESHFLTVLIDGPDELEPRADNCSKVYVWHTRTEQPKLNREHNLAEPSNHGIELR